MTTPPHVLAAVRSIPHPPIPHPRQETAMTAPELTADVRGLLDQLDQAHAAATPGPWKVRDDGVTVEIEGGDRESVRDKHGFHDADAALIVAAVNHLPRLTAALRAVAELASQLEGLVDDETVDETARIAHAWTLHRLRTAITAVLSPAEVTR